MMEFNPRLPMKAHLPTREEINVYDSLDERSACRNFLGKTLEEAEGLFRRSFINYQEDLFWMGPIAFRYYVPAAIRYLQTPEARGDSDAFSCFIGLLEIRFKNEPQELRPVAEELRSICRFIVENYDQFDIPSEIYGNLRPRYEKMASALDQSRLVE